MHSASGRCTCYRLFTDTVGSAQKHPWPLVSITTVISRSVPACSSGGFMLLTNINLHILTNQMIKENSHISSLMIPAMVCVHCEGLVTCPVRILPPLHPTLLRPALPHPAPAVFETTQTACLARPVFCSPVVSVYRQTTQKLW